MKVRTALFIDRCIGTPLCWMLNFITRSVGFILRRNHRPPYDPRRILLIKMMGMGSIVEALPLIKGLAGHFPAAEIRMLCFPETAILTRRLAPIAAVFNIDNGSLFRLAITTLRAVSSILRWRPDLVIDLEYRSKFSSLLTTLTAAKNRAGLFDVTTAFREYLHTHLVYANPRQHVADLYAHLGRVFGVESFEPLERCADALRIDPTEEMEATQFVEEHGGERPLVLINANAGELCLERRWPAERFAALAAELVGSARVMLVGSPAERDYVESVRATIPGAVRADVFNAAGALSFGAYLALLKRAALFITNDSGPMHLAALLGAPVVSLWGPGEASTCGPRTLRHIAVSEFVFCSPCLYITHEPPCGGNNICMKSMPVARVLEAARQLAPELFPRREPSVIPPPSPSRGEDLPGLVLRPRLVARTVVLP